MSRTAGLAEVLRRHGPRYLASHELTPSQAKVWRAITACRTAVLGGHVDTCDVCGTTRHVYHSCRNRHCPQCQTRAKEAWLAQRRRELLPVPYFHLVFTLPHALHGLIAQQPRRLYETLFAAAAGTLTEFAASPRHLGGEMAFSLVLHTWKQDLGRHVHVHALVAGGALTADGVWVRSKRGFLFPVKALSRVFRGKFVAALEAQRTAGHLPGVANEGDWRRLKTALYAHAWVVYAKQPLGGPEQVLEYLGRYTHRVAISNERIVAVDEAGVAFRVRAGSGTGKKRTLRLSGEAFIERFLLHVLPRGFKRIRHYGLLAPAHKAVKLVKARAALAVPPPDPAVIESVADFMRRVERLDWDRCPHCQGGKWVSAPLPPVRAAGASARGPP
ncbi:MAG: IS91 family transposase [Rhodocyclaceae bacterium]|nr:IS91 family transposase [Rhodocyclaceae bacterium]